MNEFDNNENKETRPKFDSETGERIIYPDEVKQVRPKFDSMTGERIIYPDEVEDTRPKFDPMTGEKIVYPDEVKEYKPKFDPITGERIVDASEQNQANNSQEKDNYFSNSQGQNNEKDNYFSYKVEDNNANLYIDQGKDNNILGILSLVFGIISIVCCSFFGVPIVFGIVGIVLSSIQLKKSFNGVALAGLITSIVGVLLCLITIISLPYADLDKIRQGVEYLYVLLG